jgi:hypothetical protein
MEQEKDRTAAKEEEELKKVKIIIPQPFLLFISLSSLTPTLFELANVRL